MPQLTAQKINIAKIYRNRYHPNHRTISAAFGIYAAFFNSAAMSVCFYGRLHIFTYIKLLLRRHKFKSVRKIRKILYDFTAGFPAEETVCHAQAKSGASCPAFLSFSRTGYRFSLTYSSPEHTSDNPILYTFTHFSSPFYIYISNSLHIHITPFAAVDTPLIPAKCLHLSSQADAVSYFCKKIPDHLRNLYMILFCLLKYTCLSQTCYYAHICVFVGNSYHMNMKSACKVAQLSRICLFCHSHKFIRIIS